MEHLNELVACQFKNTNDLGISADAKEAILFAVLANETITGSPTNFGTKQGIPSVLMGKISFPD
jgi:anhydro-N-acetylmuramic acid kinase